MLIRRAMIPITTSSSTRVKPSRLTGRLLLEKLIVRTQVKMTAAKRNNTVYSTDKERIKMPAAIPAHFA